MKLIPVIPKALHVEGKVPSDTGAFLPQIGALAESEQEIKTILESQNCQLTLENYQRFEKILCPERLVRIVEDVLGRPSSLERIAKRSYQHPLGFSKLVLAENWNDGQGWDLRIHIWYPQSRLVDSDLTESLHSHRWNFASRIISGKLANHCYHYRQMEGGDESWYKVALGQLQLLSPESRHELIRLLRRYDLSLIGGEDVSREIDWQSLEELTGLRPQELMRISQIYSKYQNMLDRTSFVENYDFAGYFESHFLRTTLYRSGELYFHPLEEAHRLSTDPGILNSTFVLVGPSLQEPGMYRRDYEFFEKGTVGRDLYKPEALARALEEYLRFLNSQL
jgi:hypothetical protein